MSNAFQELLDASIQYLTDLKRNGTRFVVVSPDRLRELTALKSRPQAQAPTSAGPQSAARSETTKPTAPSGTMAPMTETSASAVAPATEALQGEARLAAFADLRERALSCVKCSHLATSRKNVVFGVGNVDADLMFVGEAPGADEDQAGEPFVGKAGQLLTKIIETMGLRRDQVYIANILKCRPDTPGQAFGNRKPTADEMRTCSPYLHAQIDLIRPKVLVALGGTAVEGLLGEPTFVTQIRGKWKTYRGIPMMPTYHPAYLLRNQALIEKRKVWEDMLLVMEKIGMPISERQRGFFLKP